MDISSILNDVLKNYPALAVIAIILIIASYFYLEHRKTTSIEKKLDTTASQESVDSRASQESVNTLIREKASQESVDMLMRTKASQESVDTKASQESVNFIKDIVIKNNDLINNARSTQGNVESALAVIQSVSIENGKLNTEKEKWKEKELLYVQQIESLKSDKTQVLLEMKSLESKLMSANKEIDTLSKMVEKQTKQIKQLTKQNDKSNKNHDEYDDYEIEM